MSHRLWGGGEGGRDGTRVLDFYFYILFFTKVNKEGKNEKIGHGETPKQII